MRESREGSEGYTSPVGTVSEPRTKREKARGVGTAQDRTRRGGDARGVLEHRKGTGCRTRNEGNEDRLGPVKVKYERSGLWFRAGIVSSPLPPESPGPGGRFDQTYSPRTPGREPLEAWTSEAPPYPGQD